MITYDFKKNIGFQCDCGGVNKLFNTKGKDISLAEDNEGSAKFKTKCASCYKEHLLTLGELIDV